MGVPLSYNAEHDTV